MDQTIVRRCHPGALLCALILASTASVRATPGPIELVVDAHDAARGVLHSVLKIPVQAGPLALEYPEWVQGEHTPTGPIMQLGGLLIRANGASLTWRRNPLDMFEITLEIPAGVSTIEVSFDYLSPPESFGAGYGESPNTTPHLAMVDWTDLVLYPRGARDTEIPIHAGLELPTGWAFDTALPVTGHQGDAIDFAPTTLYTLIDSPVLAGDVIKVFDFGESGTIERLTIAADHASALQVPPERVDAYRRLPREALALFGARHYRSYHWLLALGSTLDENGLEHHESSDDRGNPGFFLEPTRLLQAGSLLPHEYVHSWNGKYRRPQGLATDTPQAPLQGDLLWVYEGLTRYLGDFILTTRSGIRSVEESEEYLAWVAANEDRNRPGRQWRPLGDTAVAVQILGGAPRPWTAFRRSLDYYDESLLIWLEVDTILRSRSAQKLSLDDFCKAFFGGPESGPAVLPYNRQGVIAALSKLVPYDWTSFFAARIDAVQERAPLGGLEGSGWRLVYSAKPNAYQKARAQNSDTVDLSFSLGLWLKLDGTIADIDVGGAAWQAGLGPGMKIVAINGRTWSAAVAGEEIAASATSGQNLGVTATRGEELRTFSIAYHDGERIPHLERTTGPDLLAAILAPKSARPKK